MISKHFSKLNPLLIEDHLLRVGGRFSMKYICASSFKYFLCKKDLRPIFVGDEPYNNKPWSNENSKLLSCSVRWFNFTEGNVQLHFIWQDNKQQ